MNKAKMILSLLLVLFASVSLSAQDVGKRISLNVSSQPMSSVLKEIGKSSGVKILFTYNDVRSLKVTASLSNVTAQEAVEKVISGHSLTYVVREGGKYISILKQEVSSVVDNTFRGRVVDQDGQALPGANITSAGRSIAATDGNGGFSIKGEAGKALSLTFSYMGYESQTLIFNQPVQGIEVVLKEDNHMFDEVVVTGYQTLSKERSAGSFSKVDGKEIATKSLSTNSILESLEGMGTGLSVNHDAGAEKYTIRGITSLNSEKAPLYVVDGVPMAAELVEDMVSTNDIASVTVLKDATAASIWGSQAANGVIVITTKRGQNNSRVKISYNGSFTSYGKPDYDYMGYMDGEMFMKNALEMFDIYNTTYNYNTALTSNYGGATHSLCMNNMTAVVWPHEVAMYEYQEGKITAQERDARLAQLIQQDGRKQYEDYFMSNKLYTKHNVAFRGGDSKHSYYLSGEYKGDQGDSKDWTNKFAINAYQDYQLTKWLKLDATVNATTSNTKGHLSPYTGNSNEGGFYNQMNLTSTAKYYNLPYNIFSDANGWIDQSAMVLSPTLRANAEAVTGLDLSFYPVQDFNNSSLAMTSTNIRLNVGATIDLCKGLKYEGRYQYLRQNNRSETFHDANNYLVNEERAQTFNPTSGSFRVPTTGGYYGVANTVGTDWTLRNQLSYNGDFKDGLHKVTALAGTEVRSYKTTGYVNNLRGYNMQTMRYEYYDLYALLNNVMPVALGSYAMVNGVDYSQTEIAKKYFSLYANAAYSYADKYIINASTRVDQSNLFGSDPSKQFKPISSVGLAWKMSNEKFMEGADWIDALTARLSLGMAGNSPKPGTGGKYDILSSTVSSYFPGPGFSIATPANDKLTWEKTRIINVGFDIYMLHNRLGITAEYYNKYTRDLIGTQLLNPTTGWASTTGNLGELSNKGFELSVKSHNVKGSDFNWYTTFTLTTNKNKIEKLDVEQPITTAAGMISARYVEGYPVGALFSYRYAGLDNNGYTQAYDKDGNIITGWSIDNLTKDDAVYSGSTIPKVTGGLTNRFTYKDFDLSFLLVYNFGAKMRTEGLYFYGRPGANLPKYYDNRWRQPGDEAFTDIPKYTASSDWNLNTSCYYYADTHIANASYIRMRDITLSYNLSRSLCQRMNIEGARLSAQVGNPFIIAFNKEGINPEAYSYGAGSWNARQDCYGPSYSIGVNVNF